MKSKLEIASQIIDIDTRHNAGGLKPLTLYTGKIEGKDFQRTSRWWVQYKSIVEGVKSSDHRLISARVYNGWTEEEAINARIGESRQAYKRRTNDKKYANAETINTHLDWFNYRPVNHGAA